MSTSAARRLTAVAASGLVLVACGGGTTETSGGGEPREADPLDSADIDELYEQAQEEGEVVVYSFTSRIADVESVFEDTYPGVDLVPNDISATEQIARLRAESDAQTATADVAYISDAPVVLTELVDSGILRNYVPPRVADVLPEQYAAPLVANRLSTKVLMYNEEAHPDGSPVTNLWELTDDAWEGRVVMVDPNVRGDYLDLVSEIVLRSQEMEASHEELYGEPVDLDDGVSNAGEQWLEDLYDNELVLVDDTDNVNAAIGQIGQDSPPVGFTSYSDRRDNEEEGWALQAATGVEPAPGIAFPALLGVVRDAENPAAARLLIDFLMGDDSETGGPGFEPFYVAGDYPVREDVVAPDGAVSLAELGAWEIDPEELAGVRGDVGHFLLTLE